MKKYEVFEYEKSENWGKAMCEYKQLFLTDYSEELAVHFMFFCWCVLGKIYDTADYTLDEDELEETINVVSDKLMENWRVLSVPYLLAIIYMKRVCPEFFDNISIEDTMDMLAWAKTHHPVPDKRGIQILCDYQSERFVKFKDEEERNAVAELYPEGSILQRYTLWLLDSF